MSTQSSQQLLDEVVGLTKRLRMPYLRKAAPDVLTTAKAQRWDPAEALRVLLEEEAKGRDAATIATRRRQAGFPTGKTLDTWRESASSIPPATQQALRNLEGIRRAENLAVVGPSGTGKSHLLEALGNAAIDDGLTVAWFTVETLGQLVRRHRADDTVTKAVTRVLKADLIVVDDFGLLPVPAEAAERCSASSTLPTNAAPSRSAPTSTPAGSTNCCPPPSPPPAWTGSCTTHTSWAPKATPTASPKPATARG